MIIIEKRQNFENYAFNLKSRLNLLSKIVIPISRNNLIKCIRNLIYFLSPSMFKNKSKHGQSFDYTRTNVINQTLIENPLKVDIIKAKKQKNCGKDLNTYNLN